MTPSPPSPQNTRTHHPSLILVPLLLPCTNATACLPVVLTRGAPAEPLSGESFANAFVHFMPEDWDYCKDTQYISNPLVS